MIETKKKFVWILALAIMMVFAFAGCTDSPIVSESNPSEPTESDAVDNTATTDAIDDAASSAPKEELKIGISLSDLTNPIWAEMVDYATTYAKETYNAVVTTVQFDSDSSKQVSQIETFIESGFDAIILCPTDPDSVEDVCKKAKDAGIAVCAYTTTIQNEDADYLVPEYDAGYAAGQSAVSWIKAHDSLKNADKIEVGICNYRQIPTVIDRENGFEAALKEGAPNAEVVVRANALTNLEGLEAAETFLQAYPDMKIIYSIGDGGGLGANEAVIAAGKDTDDFGIFCVDGTLAACQAIKDNQPLRATMSLGGGKAHGRDMIDICANLINGVEQPKNNYMPVEAVDISNLDKYCEEQGYVLK